MLNWMVEQQPDDLDLDVIFHALATRFGGPAWRR